MSRIGKKIISLGLAALLLVGSVNTDWLTVSAAAEQTEEESMNLTQASETVQNSEETGEVSGNDAAGNGNVNVTFEGLTDEQWDESCMSTGYMDLLDDFEIEVYNPVKCVTGGEETIPVKYHTTLAELNATYPATRNQNPFGTCWAHASLAIAEMSMIKGGYESKDSINYSELALAAFTYNPVVDPLGLTAGDTTRYKIKSDETFGYDANQKNLLQRGGNELFAFRTMIRGIGPMKEEAGSIFEYSEENGLALMYAYDDGNADAYSSKAYTQDAILTDYRILNYDSNREEIKRTIMEKGIVSVSYYAFTSSYGTYFTNSYNAEHNCYYQTYVSGQTNHAVTLVGWDDTFPKEYFTKTPSDNGAFLVRNSWSTASGESYYNYFWISYYDASISDDVYTADFVPAQTYDNNYQYDGAVLTSYSGYTTQIFRTANVYTIGGCGGAEYEYLESVSFSFNNLAEQPYEISIYLNPDLDNNNPGEHLENLDVSGVTNYPGYYTVKLPERVRVAKGTKVAVVMRTCRMDFERSSSGTWYETTATIQSGQSYCSSNGSTWTDNTSIGKGNWVIKLFTTDSFENENYSNLLELIRTCSSLSRNDYSDPSYLELEKALNKAKALDVNSSSEALASAYSDLTAARAALKTPVLTVAVSSNPSGSGLLTGGGRYAVGETVVLKSKAAGGYVFGGWYQNDALYSSDVNVNIPVTEEMSGSMAFEARYTTNETATMLLYIIGGKVRFTAASDGFSYALSETGTGSNYSFDEYTKGTAIKMEAQGTGTPASTFLYWVNENGRILSTDSTYSFTLATDTKIYAYFKSSSSDAAYVTFKDMNGKVLSDGSNSLSLTDGSGTKYCNVIIPSHGTFAGYEFAGWADEDGLVVSEAESGEIKITGDTTLYATYNRLSGYTVTVNGTPRAETYAFGDYVTVTAEATGDGHYFSGWYIGATKVSNKRSYSFYVTGNMALTSKYEGESVLKETPVISLQLGSRQVLSSSNNQVQMTANWTLPEGYTLVEGGIVRTLNESYSSSLTITAADGSTIKKHVSTLSTANGTYVYTLELGPNSKTKTLYAVGYVTYINDATGAVETIYTPVQTSAP